MLFFFLLCLINAASPDGRSGREKFMSPSLSDPFSYNLTVSHVSARSIRVNWNCKGQFSPDKYEVTLQPYKESYKIVETVPHHDCSLKMRNRVEPDTMYQVFVASIAGKIRRRSNTLYFRTPKEEESLPEVSEEGQEVEDPDSFESEESNKSLRLPPVRLVEISLVGMALVLWAGAIVLFFHRWGKIRMLLPYQPAYKEMTQTNSACTNCSLTPHHQCNRLQQIQIQADYGASTSAAARVPVRETACSPMRPRLNSFIGYNQSDIPEVPARICRKAKSAEQLRYDPRYDDFDYFDYQDI